MPPLPCVSGVRIVRALERNSFKVARVSGSHHLLNDVGMTIDQLAP